MTRWLTLFIKISGIAIIAMPFSRQAFGGATLTGVQMSRCTKDGNRCWQVNSDKVSIGSVMPIYSVAPIRLELTDRISHSSKIFESPLGYIDFESNHIVLQKFDQKGVLTETTLDLDSFQQRTFVIR